MLATIARSSAHGIEGSRAGRLQARGGRFAREQFLPTTDAVSDWARRQRGFTSRDLCHDVEGDRWIEVVWWATMSDAQAAAKLAMTSESCAPMFRLIDMESTLMLHGEPAISPVLAAATAAGA